MDDHKKHTKHAEEVVAKIIELHDQGTRSADIYKKSKELFGYVIKESTISVILRRHGKDPKINSYRRTRRKKKIEESTK